MAQRQNEKHIVLPATLLTLGSAGILFYFVIADESGLYLYWLIVLAPLMLVAGAILMRRYFRIKRRRHLSIIAWAVKKGYEPSDSHKNLDSVGAKLLAKHWGMQTTRLIEFFGGVGQIGEVKFLIGEGVKRENTSDYKGAVACGGFVYCMIPMIFPAALIISPEYAFHRVTDMALGSDINFENLEFSNRYRVHGSSRRFAYDIFHPQMIEFVLSLPTCSITLAPGYIWFSFNSRFLEGDDEYQRLLGGAMGFLKRLPPHIVADAEAAWRHFNASE